MTTAATSLLGLALPVQGELQGTWGDVVNNSLTSLLDTAVAGTTTLSTDADVTLTTTTLAANQARQAILLWTANGTTTRNITAPAQSKIYTVINKSAGTQSIVLRGVGPTTGVTIVKGESAVCAWNGSDFIKISNTSGAGVFTDLTVSGTATFSGGTANGVAYLNGSKVLTTGSALVFDGTNLGLGVTPSAWSSTNGGAFQFGSGYSSLYSYSNAVTLGSNVYYKSGTANTYFASGVGSSAYQQLNGVHYWLTAGSGTAGSAITFTQAMTLDASGNLGVGTSSPAARVHSSGYVVSGASGGSDGQFILKRASDGVTVGSLVADSANSLVNLQTGYGTLVFTANSLERARIDSSGNLLVGTTSGTAYRMQVIANGTNTALFKTDGAYAPVDYWQANTTGNNPLVQFYTETSATLRGSITYNRGAGQVAYNVTSDYRSKTVNGLVQNALSKVAELKPSTGRMNGAEFDIDFFVAHELQEIVPSAVTGEKDAVNEDGTPKYQMVDKSALIPLLTAAIQEQQALITSLTERITALENK